MSLISMVRLLLLFSVGWSNFVCFPALTIQSNEPFLVQNAECDKFVNCSTGLMSALGIPPPYPDPLWPARKFRDLVIDNYEQMGAPNSLCSIFNNFTKCMGSQFGVCLGSKAVMEQNLQISDYNATGYASVLDAVQYICNVTNVYNVTASNWNCTKTSFPTFQECLAQFNPETMKLCQYNDAYVGCVKDAMTPCGSTVSQIQCNFFAQLNGQKEDANITKCNSVRICANCAVQLLLSTVLLYTMGLSLIVLSQIIC